MQAIPSACSCTERFLIPGACTAGNDAERSASMYDKEESIVDIDGEEAVEVGNPEAGFCASEGRYTLRWLRPVATERVAAPTNAVPIVILPGGNKPCSQVRAHG